ncbi:MAG: PspC domain-containing protein [Xanthomonadaceae bacterium]|nr:PspC domain-containing protein [Xanthomonadaceae bacterium]MDE1885490.1 PspC domain-containing protein [Xanthomonadaceae bacterium]MDE1962054.1 PspC domain-containing protein [Xanthomonadaceae bacterium]MDE2085310.1 PspC domain-containing protein [Xanthomonadaceae bacterium]MDE2256510.1 PspC domain-containing protein [Xanthomonadaceae bacterium]
MTEQKPLRRSRSDRKIAGVCGGLAQHFGLDPTYTRIAYALLTVLSAAFPGVLIYLLLWWLVPEED